VKAEGTIDFESENVSRYQNLNKNITNAMSYAAVSTARDVGAACIVPVTDSGFVARMVARSRPRCPILAVTADPVVYMQLNLSWGCTPYLSSTPFHGDSEVFDASESAAFETGLAQNGDIIVALAGVPVGAAGTTNTIRVRTVGNVLAKGQGNNRGIVQGTTTVFTDSNIKERSNFESGDILVCTQTDDSMMDCIRKAAAIVVGSWEDLDFNHSETVAKALQIPLLKVNVRVVDFVKSGLAVTVDTENGLLLNGFRL
jgi:pyruvate kinase